jgi:hypothetical protein
MRVASALNRLRTGRSPLPGDKEAIIEATASLRKEASLLRGDEPLELASEYELQFFAGLTLRSLAESEGKNEHRATTAAEDLDRLAEELEQIETADNEQLEHLESIFIFSSSLVEASLGHAGEILDRPTGSISGDV